MTAGAGLQPASNAAAAVAGSTPARHRLCGAGRRDGGPGRDLADPPQLGSGQSLGAPDALPHAGRRPAPDSLSGAPDADPQPRGGPRLSRAVAASVGGERHPARLDRRLRAAGLGRLAAQPGAPRRAPADHPRRPRALLQSRHHARPGQFRARHGSGDPRRRMVADDRSQPTLDALRASSTFCRRRCSSATSRPMRDSASSSGSSKPRRARARGGAIGSERVWPTPLCVAAGAALWLFAVPIETRFGGPGIKAASLAAPMLDGRSVDRLRRDHGAGHCALCRAGTAAC